MILFIDLSRCCGSIASLKNYTTIAAYSKIDRSPIARELGIDHLKSFPKLWRSSVEMLLRNRNSQVCLTGTMF